MKKPFTIALYAYICLVFSDIQGQNYIPFDLDSSVWVMKTVIPILGPNDNSEYWSIYTDGDTIIANRSYKNAWVKNLCSIQYNGNGDPVYTTVFPINDFLIGGIRQDGKKVYFKKYNVLEFGFQPGIYNLSTGNEYLLYDFDVSMGDTVDHGNSEHTIVRNDLGLIQNHQQYKISNSSAWAYPNETGEWVEGIGSSYGLFGSINSYLSSLECFKQNEKVILFNNTFNPCENVVSVRDGDHESSLSIYPNPVHNTVIVKSGDNGILRLNIIDLSGKTVRHYEYGTGKNIIQINLSSLGNSIYLIEAILDDESHYIARLIKY